MLALAPAAGAHSTLIATEPARDRVVEESPKHVLLRFDEPVETALGSIAVYDGDGNRVDAETITRPAPERGAVAIDGELERGTYTVAWRVISADSDPINGAWVFHVKERGEQPAGVAAQVLEDTPFTTSVFYLGGRFLDFALLLACVGGMAALVLRSGPRVGARCGAGCWRSSRRSPRRSPVGLAVELALQGAAAAGTRPRVRVPVGRDLVGGRHALRRVRAVARGLAAALCAVALVARARSAGARSPRSSVGGRGCSAAGLVVTSRRLSGHASVSGAVLRMVADCRLHVQAAGGAGRGGLGPSWCWAAARPGGIAGSSRPRACRASRRTAVVSVAVLFVAGDHQRLPPGARLARALGDRVRDPAAGQDRAGPAAARPGGLQQPLRRAAPARADRVCRGAPPLPPSRGRRARGRCSSSWASRPHS